MEQYQQFLDGSKFDELVIELFSAAETPYTNAYMAILCHLEFLPGKMAHEYALKSYSAKNPVGAYAMGLLHKDKATQYFQEAADAGYYPAYLKLGDSHKDPKLAYSAYMIAYNAGETKELIIKIGNNLVQQNKPAEAFEWFLGHSQYSEVEKILRDHPIVATPQYYDKMIQLDNSATSEFLSNPAILDTILQHHKNAQLFHE